MATLREQRRYCLTSSIGNTSHSTEESLARIACRKFGWPPRGRENLGTPKGTLLLAWPSHRCPQHYWCKTCPSCATRKTPPSKGRASLKSVQAGYPLQIVATDIMGPLPENESGNRYVLVASDYFTRWVEAYAIPNQEATTVARKLVDEMFCRFSPPEQLHSYQGRQFESELIRSICSILQIRKTGTTPYHPQGDGLVERFNRTLLNMLATTVKENPTSWEDHIRKVCFAYNSSIHPTTGYSPFYLMFGRNARSPADLLFSTDRP